MDTGKQLKRFCWSGVALAIRDLNSKDNFTFQLTGLLATIITVGTVATVKTVVKVINRPGVAGAVL